MKAPFLILALLSLPLSSEAQISYHLQGLGGDVPGPLRRVVAGDFSGDGYSDAALTFADPAAPLGAQNHTRFFYDPAHHHAIFDWTSPVLDIATYPVAPVSGSSCEKAKGSR